MAKQKQNKRKSTFISLYIWTGATWMTSAKKKYNTIQEKEVKETCPTYGVEDCWEVKKNFEFHLQTNFSQKFKLDQQNWSFFFCQILCDLCEQCETPRRVPNRVVSMITSRNTCDMDAWCLPLAFLHSSSEEAIKFSFQRDTNIPTYTIKWYGCKLFSVIWRTVDATGYSARTAPVDIDISINAVKTTYM